MKSISSWLLVMFMGMFWLFRVIVAFQAQYGQTFGGFIVFNSTVEVALLFVTILCMILVLRRNWLGGIIYLVSYGYYFGGYIFSNITSEEGMSTAVMQNVLVSAIRNYFSILCVFWFAGK